MATTLTDLMDAIDAYMKANGSGGSGPYLASKIGDLFDNNDSPLNAKTGPLSEMSKRIVTFYKKIFDAEKGVGKMLDETNKMTTNVKNFNTKMKKSLTGLDDLNKALKGIGGRIPTGK